MIRWSICIRNIDSGELLLARSPARTLRTASVGKVLLLVHIAELATSGTVGLGERLRRRPGDAVADSGVWQYLVQDTLTIADLCELVGMASDNLATNVLLGRFALTDVAATAARWGLEHTALHDRVRDVRGPAHPATLSTGSAGELSELMAHLHGGRDTPGTVGHLVLGWLGKGMDLSQAASGWGLDPLSHLGFDRGLRVANKTGTDLGVRAEIGVLCGAAAAIAYAVIANWDVPDDAGQRDLVMGRQRRLGLRIAGAARGDW